MNTSFGAFSAAFAGLVLLSGCGGGGTNSTGGEGGEGGGGVAEPIAAEITFEARVGSAPFDCKTKFTGLGTAATEATITDFRMYVYDVRLLRADGSEVPLELEQDGLWQYKTLALLDFEDRSGACANGTTEVNNKLRGKVAAGDYDGLAFTLGVPFDLNHGDAAVAPSPLNLSGLFWSWNGGYKFFRADAVPTGADTAFNVHLGSTGCTPADEKVVSCAWPNRAEVKITGFDPLTTKVFVDYAALVEGNDLSKDTGGAPGCMSGADDPECAPIFQRFGIKLMDGSPLPDNQSLFHVE